MGGVGSGNYIRLGGRPTVEEQRRVDVRFMHQQGWLYSGCKGFLTWTCNGEKSGSVMFEVKSKHFILSFRYREVGGSWESVEQRIPFDSTPCNYGGWRYWFLCPGCGRRVALLCGAGRFFQCRHCYKLTYGSKLESKADQRLRKAQKLREKLGVKPGAPVIFKPKNMHQKTFDKLERELVECETFYWNESLRKIGI